MTLASDESLDIRSRAPAAVPALAGACLLLFAWDARAGAVAAFAAVAMLAYRARMLWLAACAAAWVAVFLAVLFFPGPYDSWAGPAVVPVVAGYVGCYLSGWAVGRWLAARQRARSKRREATGRPTLAWPSETRLRVYLLVVLAVAVLAAVLRFRGTVPPLFASNPDAARQVLRERSSIVVGLLSEAWTLGMAISLLRALTGGRRYRRGYLVLAAIFTFGAALGASKNSVLVGIAPALVAALSVRREQPPHRTHSVRRQARIFTKTRVVVMIGLVVLGAAIFLGGQRTLAGSGTFENAFRASYGNPVTASLGSLDLALSSSTETFGRLWAQRDDIPAGHGAYSLMFMGSHADLLFAHRVDLYATTAQLSQPYYMNTATFVAIPLLDYGVPGAAVFLLLLGLCTGLGERWLEFSAGPAQQIGRGFVIYLAIFGVYELYPAIYPTWLALVPGLLCLHLMGRRA
jgi:hypothetical protein